MDSALNEVVMKPFSWRLISVTLTYRIRADKAEPRLIPATPSTGYFSFSFVAKQTKDRHAYQKREEVCAQLVRERLIVALLCFLPCSFEKKT